jgi:hypothetical protein
LFLGLAYFHIALDVNIVYTMIIIQIMVGSMDRHCFGLVQILKNSWFGSSSSSSSSFFQIFGVPQKQTKLDADDFGQR